MSRGRAFHAHPGSLFPGQSQCPGMKGDRTTVADAEWNRIGHDERGYFYGIAADR